MQFCPLILPLLTPGNAVCCTHLFAVVRVTASAFVLAISKHVTRFQVRSIAECLDIDPVCASSSSSSSYSSSSSSTTSSVTIAH
jgi:hypothetical protein